MGWTRGEGEMGSVGARPGRERKAGLGKRGGPGRGLGFAVFIFLSVFLFLFLFKTVLKLNLKQGEDGIKNCFANIVIYF